MDNSASYLVKSLESEMRAMKAQNLVTDPRDAVVSYPLNATASGVRANDPSMDHAVLVEFVPDDEYSAIPPVINLWLHDIHVPANDFGINEGYLTVVRYNPTNYYVRCPFIAYSTTDTYSMRIHCTALVPGHLEVSIA